jgi:PIN domain nuclease of toxin-antitoxin system
VKLLLDTHLLLWLSLDAPELSARARTLIEEPGNALFFSTASIWEIAIKRGLGRSDFTIDPRLLRRGLLDNGYQEILIESRHAIATLELPPLHKDPFDRILIAQAAVDGLMLATVDDMVARYPGPIIRV